MNQLGKIAVWLVGSLALSAGLRAVNASSLATALAPANPVSPAAVSPAEMLTENPYGIIAPRNIFGLNPPPDPNAQKEDDALKNLPKITASGIMGVFGHLRVLYKVNGSSKPGQKEKEQFYNLPEGQAKDGIEVVKIDDKNKLVTFNNNGTVQELPLINTPSGPSGPPPAAGGSPAAVPMSPPQGGGFGSPAGAPAFTRFGGRPGGRVGNSGGNPGSAAGANNGAAPSFQNIPTRNNIYQAEPTSMTPESTVIAIEAKRAELMNSPHPAYSPGLLPPTPLTQFNTPGGQ